MKRYKIAGLTAGIAVVMLAARSDAGAPVWQTAAGLMLCGVLALWAWLGYQRDVEAERSREIWERRSRHDAEPRSASRFTHSGHHLF